MRGLTATLPLLFLVVAVLRHYQPPNTTLAFPSGEIVIGVGWQLPALCLRR